MSEVLSALIPNIKNVNNIKLIEKIDNIDIIVSLPHQSCPQIIFNVKSKKKEINESINELYELIDKLYKKIEEQQNIINEQNNKIINLEKNFIEKETKVNYSFNKDSKIIMNDENKEKMIREWINPNKNIKFTLLFRKSRDGSNCSDFHRNCDNKGPTLTLIETDKGYKFGGYTPLDWENPSSGKDKNDELTFLFSLNQMKKFTKMNNDRSICVVSCYGPIFGNGTDLYINSDLNTGVTNCSTFLKNRELTNGESSFNVKEIEIYKVEFI